MQKLFENWREFRKSILNEQRPEARALQDIEQDPERWSSSIEDARKAAEERAYGVTTSQRPLAASHESRQEEALADLEAYAATGSLLALLLGMGFTAAAGTSLPVTVPNIMGGGAPQAIRYFHPHPVVQEVLMKAANYFSNRALASLAFQVMFVGWSGMKIDMAVEYFGPDWYSEQKDKLKEVFKIWAFQKATQAEEGFRQAIIRVFTNKVLNNESPEQIGAFLDDVGDFYKQVQSVV